MSTIDRRASLGYIYTVSWASVRETRVSSLDQRPPPMRVTKTQKVAGVGLSDAGPWSGAGSVRKMDLPVLVEMDAVVGVIAMANVAFPRVLARAEVG